jgi:hypothetical protein
VVVDSKSGNQMLYLPLDKIMEQRRSNGSEPEVSVTIPRSAAGAGADPAANTDPRARAER